MDPWLDRDVAANPLYENGGNARLIRLRGTSGGLKIKVDRIENLRWLVGELRRFKDHNISHIWSI